MFGKFIPECELNTTEAFPELLGLADPSVKLPKVGSNVVVSGPGRAQ
jgi:hypothetical protein